MLTRFGLLCICLTMSLGCGSGASAPPTADEVQKNNAAMEADMKTMMQQVPQKPK